MQQLVIVRGLPGTGKSTIAKELFPNHTHWEADKFFVNQFGKYCFQPRLIPYAHQWCQKGVQDALNRGESVIVTNTFTRKHEYMVYQNMAKDMGIPCYVMIANGNYENVHGVPPETLAKMAARWEN